MRQTRFFFIENFDVGILKYFMLTYWNDVIGRSWSINGQP